MPTPFSFILLFPVFIVNFAAVGIEGAGNGGAGRKTTGSKSAGSARQQRHTGAAAQSPSVEGTTDGAEHTECGRESEQIGGPVRIPVQCLLDCSVADDESQTAEAAGVQCASPSLRRGAPRTRSTVCTCSCSQRKEHSTGLAGSEKEPSSGVVVPLLSTRMHLHREGAGVVRRNMILVEDLADAIQQLYRIYHIRGGSDVNIMRQDLICACEMLLGLKITNPQHWTEAAERMLQHGWKTRDLMNSPRTTGTAGILRPPPSFLQANKNSTASRRRALEAAIEKVVDQVALPAYEVLMRQIDAPVAVKRVICNRLGEAVVQLSQINRDFRGMWYMYAEFLLIWICLRHMKLQRELEGTESQQPTNP